MELALQGLAIPALTILRPAALIGEREESRLREKAGVLAAALLRPFLYGRWRKYRSIEAACVARAMLRTAAQAKAGARILESDEIAELGQ